MPQPAHSVTWDTRQSELWDRLFQVTGDVVALAESLDDGDGGTVIKQEMVKVAMGIGVSLVRANAAETAAHFREYATEARLRAIETDYWLRLAYILQQRDDVQRDLSSIISQYAAIIDLLEKLTRHAGSAIGRGAKVKMAGR